MDNIWRLVEYSTDAVSCNDRRYLTVVLHRDGTARSVSKSTLRSLLAALHVLDSLSNARQRLARSALFDALGEALLGGVEDPLRSLGDGTDWKCGAAVAVESVVVDRDVDGDDVALLQHRVRGWYAVAHDLRETGEDSEQR